ncbi:unnamed protein product, partial [Hapterophycus canaliculatus]
MRGSRRWTAVLLVCLLHLNSIRRAQGRARHAEEKQDRSRRKRHRRAAQEADEDAIFAAELLGLVHDRVRDAGDLLRIIGDTAGGLAGGSIKLLSAPVKGLSNVLDAASREVKSNIRQESEHSTTSPWTAPTAATADDPHTPGSTRFSEAAPGARVEREDGAGGDGGKDEGTRDGPDPFDRIGNLALTSLAGSLQILSTTVAGVGDAVFQAGMLAEGLAGGTGQVAEDSVRLVQRFVGWARDDIVKLNNRKAQSQSQGDSPLQGKRASSMPPSSSPINEPQTTDFSPLPEAVSSSTALTFLDVWEEVRSFGRQVIKAAVRVAVNLLCYSEHGAMPPGPRMAVLMVLALFVYDRRGHRRRCRCREQPPEAEPAVRTPQRSSPNFAATAGASAASLQSPSRSLFSRPQQAILASPTRTPVAPGSPLGRGYDVPPPSGLYPFLPSPAQARAAQARRGQTRDPSTGQRRRPGGRDHEADGPMSVSGQGVVRAEAPSGRWGWWRMRGSARDVGGCGRRYVLWLALLWLLASVIEERERDRIAWLAWDEGYRRGQATRAVDPTNEPETAAWLNHMIVSTWGGTKGAASLIGKDGGSGVNGGHEPPTSGCSYTGIFASDGLSSFVAEHLTEGFLEALEELKPNSVVGVELLEVELGSSAPRVLGIEVLDPTSSASPGWGDGRCSLEGGECVSLRVDLELASQDLRVGVRVKLSSLEKALLPTGTIRLLELYFRGSVSVRAEVRDEFPFFSTAFVALDYPPDVQVRLEQWGLDALTLGAVPAAVDEWARNALRQALAPLVLPGFMEVDAAYALCPDCPAIVPVAQPEAREQEGKPVSSVRLPYSRLPAAATAAFRPGRDAIGGGTSGQKSTGK